MSTVITSSASVFGQPLGRLVDRLGSTLLTLVAGHGEQGRIVSSVVLYDPADPPVLSEGALVLGVGINGVNDLLARIPDLAGSGAIALIVREPVITTTEVIRMAEEHALPIYGLIRGASWIQIATMLAGALDVGATGETPGSHADAGADLFGLADSLAALLQAPVTIENLSSRVMAFSADQAGTDEPRRLTILGLQVPEIYSDMQRSRGVFRQIYASERPVYVAKAEPEGLPRVAMRIRAGEEVLGSIWAVVHEPLSPQREQGMVEAAGVVALTMLRARVSADSTQRLRLGLVSMLLDGAGRAREAAQQLRFGSSPVCVIALGPKEGTLDDARMEADIQRTASALNMYLQPIYPRAVSAPLGGTIYAVIPLRADDAASAAEAERLAREFISRLDSQGEVYAGVGNLVREPSELPLSRRAADEALRVLRSRSSSTVRVATLDTMQVEALILRVADSLVADRVGVAGPIATLRTYDQEHDTELLLTLRTWLEQFGDVTAAAQVIHVHKNTFRYRLARLTEVGGIDLDDPDVRFGLMLQLRLFPAAAIG
ncbi:hypothetical protein ASD65_07065 [Microbacterium sp. Root61]|uniref:helix-turn-helix domain-containing protein n=1 Tax=Microbacterium sp. Root61 TaxID=1736570 RepID=UPI0006F2E808|nr:helix-turn-helix domain-containing protein [Microbacterium sp. Root61]KRA24205.1 hypothetical protein ASD65_07065 [Microbacterium sp. Root61]